MANPFAYTYAQENGTAPIAKRHPVWDSVDEKINGGVIIPVDSTNKVGNVIPAGTPITITSGVASVGGSKPTGLTYADAIVGANGCPVDVVTRGKFYVSRTTASINSAQITALADRILFIEDK